MHAESTMCRTTEVKHLSELFSTMRHHLISMVKAKIRKMDKAEIWKRCGNLETHGLYWWEYELA